MRNSPLHSVARNPTLVGAIAVLITILAVFLAYNANSGLPFVPTYRVTVQVPNAASIVPGNEVRIGGVRVGQVEEVRARLPRGRLGQRRPGAQARHRRRAAARPTRPS